MNGALIFDPARHRYTVDEEDIPNVSRILKDLGLSKNYDGVDPFYRDRGIAVHQAIHFYLKGTLDESSLDPVCVPYFEAARKFLGTRDISRFESEVPLHSESMAFAGTIDLIEHVSDTDVIIYDAKCTESVDRATELQLCAYQLLVEQNYKKKVRGKFPLQLKSSGEFHPLEKFQKYSDLNPMIWASIMDTYNWKCRRQRL